MMKKNLFIVVFLMSVAVGGNVPSMAQSKSKPEKEIYTWTSVSGETFEGEYTSVSGSGDSVRIRAANGQIITVPLKQLSDKDKTYVEYKNPPKLKIEYRNSFKKTMYIADPWFDDNGGSHDNQPIYVTTATFGAEVIQEGKQLYNHDLFMEVYALTKQRYDPKKKHIIAHFKSGAFRLNEENKFRHEYVSDDINIILEYELSISGGDGKRGEEYSDMLVLVRDENGDVVAYNATSEWLYKYLDQLEQLPVNAWIDHKCVRVHPTPMKSGE
jgi:hypothetical protein